MRHKTQDSIEYAAPEEGESERCRDCVRSTSGRTGKEPRTVAAAFSRELAGWGQHREETLFNFNFFFFLPFFFLYS